MSGKYVPPYLRQQQQQQAASSGSAAPPLGGAASPAASPASSPAAGAASPFARPAAAAASPSPYGGAAALPAGGFAAGGAAAHSPGLSPQREQQQPPRRRGLDALLSETAAGGAGLSAAAAGAVAAAAAAAESESVLLHPPHNVLPGGEGAAAAGRPRAPSIGSPSPTITGRSQQQQPQQGGEQRGSPGAPGALAGQQQQQHPSTTSSGGGGGGASPQQSQNRWTQMLMSHSGGGAAARAAGKYSRGGAAAAGSGGMRVVEVDGLVLLKVLKHCRENFPVPVNGQLLGVDSKDRLEVTNCFPLPQKKDILAQLQRNGEARGSGERELEERLDEEFDKYQDKMAELMHDVNVDCFTVGWYQTLSFSDLTSKHIIDSLVLYQEEVQKAVVLGVDPARAASGRTAVKAYRVHPDFLQKYHECEQDVSKYNRLKAKDILVEVAIVVVNPFLVEAFLMDWASQDPLLGQGDMESLELDQSNYLERNLLLLSTALESLGEEQERLQRYQREYLKQQQLQKHLLERRRLENEQRRLRGEPVLPVEMEGPAFRKIDPPSQLLTLLISSQAQLQCEEVNHSCCETLSKMFLLHWANARKKTSSASGAPAALGGAGSINAQAAGGGGAAALRV